MLWCLLVEIGKELLKSLIVKFVLAIVHAFLVSYSQPPKGELSLI